MIKHFLTFEKNIADHEGKIEDLKHISSNSDLNIAEESISLKNPLNNSLSTLRTSLLPSLAESLEFNVNREQNYLKLFEIGKTFSKKNPKESWIRNFFY